MNGPGVFLSYLIKTEPERYVKSRGKNEKDQLPSPTPPQKGNVIKLSSERA
jgi:hypothetical protein